MYGKEMFDSFIFNIYFFIDSDIELIYNKLVLTLNILLFLALIQLVYLVSVFCVVSCFRQI